MSDLTTTEGMLAYLQNTPFAASDIQLLSGGYSAFTYRITLQVPLSAGEETLVLKHYQERLSGYEINLDPERGWFEYKALLGVATSGLFDSNSVVQTPRAIHYDPEAHTILMTDLGSVVLLAQALTESPGIATKVGAALGDFFGRFHIWGAAPERAELRETCSRNTAATSTAYLEDRFKCMMGSIERFGLGEKWIDELVARECKAGFVRGEGEVLTMGDCWINNVLVSMPSADRGLRVYIIDWELVQPTSAEFDMGDFIGQSLRLGRKLYPQDDDGFISAVLEAYAAHRTLDTIKMAINTGTFGAGYGLGFFPKPDDPLAEGVVLTGLELARLGWIGDERGIRTSVLKGMFRPVARVQCQRCGRLEGCWRDCTAERAVTVQ